MTKTKRAAAAAPCQTPCKDNDNQYNPQGNAKKEPQRIGEIIQEVAKVERCNRSGEVSIMAIIAKRKGGNHGA